MKKISIALFIGLFLTGCARSRTDNAYQEIRETRNQWAEIDQRVEDKREAYTADFEEITFTGDPEDLTEVVLEITSGTRYADMPFLYHFYENDDTLFLYIEVYAGEELDYVQETLVVEDIQFEDGTYTVQAEDYTYYLHTFQGSIRRLRDDTEELLTPSHYVPEEVEEQWVEEAIREVGESD